MSKSFVAPSTRDDDLVAPDHNVGDHDTYYRALIARDSRFDGLFFVAVKSTGIYCRPVCPSRKPRRDRCLFFQYAASAERKGYRPCLRCRPELAPGTPTR